MAELVFVDCETTGLEVGRHQIWEVAWAVNDEPVQSFQVKHNLVNADLNALRINGYLDRVNPLYYDPWWNHTKPVTAMDIIDNKEYTFRDALRGNHLVASNPDFDSRMLAHRLQKRPWHHRLIDLAPMAMVHFGWDRPRGMADIADALRSQGYEIPNPDHSAARDVETLRACFNALMGR